MMIWFETHATSVDNENGLASGHFDVELSETGRRQARDLGTRCAGRALGAIYSSDLKRSIETAQIAFRLEPRQDRRLRECDYGEWTRRKVSEIQPARLKFIDEPFPGGESYRDVIRRVEEFLDDLPDNLSNVVIIGHRATWFALEHLLQNRDLREVIAAPWNWQAGWEYRL
jgi:broad specificity phosphatase PhoE